MQSPMYALDAGRTPVFYSFCVSTNFEKNCRRHAAFPSAQRCLSLDASTALDLASCGGGKGICRRGATPKALSARGPKIAVAKPDTPITKDLLLWHELKVQTRRTPLPSLLWCDRCKFGQRAVWGALGVGF